MKARIGGKSLLVFDTPRQSWFRPGVLRALTLGRTTMSLGTILLVVLIIALLGGFSGLGGGPFYGTGYYGGGGIGLVLIIVLVLVLLGRL